MAAPGHNKSPLPRHTVVVVPGCGTLRQTSTHQCVTGGLLIPVRQRYAVESVKAAHRLPFAVNSHTVTGRRARLV